VSDERARIPADWLALREPADAAARAVELVERVVRDLDAGGRSVIHDLGSGTGSMGRWLAPRLPGAQHWALHDLDTDLLQLAARELPEQAADGAVVTVETRTSDLAALEPGDLEGATLITASAVLDLLTEVELSRLVAACASARCPVLMTLSVVGRVELVPADPLDARVATAFDAHQRRTTSDGRLLGPDAVRVASAAFARHGCEVLERPSPWRLGPGEAALAAAWFTGWIGAACEHEPALAAEAAAYADRRRTEAAAGRLAATVHHADLLALPR
jgi:hypothetical protein